MKKRISEKVHREGRGREKNPKREEKHNCFNGHLYQHLITPTWPFLHRSYSLPTPSLFSASSFSSIFSETQKQNKKIRNQNKTSGKGKRKRKRKRKKNSAQTIQNNKQS